MHLVSCTNTHRDVTDLVNHGMVKNTKPWISWERNKKILNLCFRWHILRSYRFLVEVTFKVKLVALLKRTSNQGFFLVFLVFPWMSFSKSLTKWHFLSPPPSLPSNAKNCHFFLAPVSLCHSSWHETRNIFCIYGHLILWHSIKGGRKGQELQFEPMGIHTLTYIHVLTHFRPMFHLCRNQVVGFY